jgi:SET domain-containing protein
LLFSTLQQISSSIFAADLIHLMLHLKKSLLPGAGKGLFSSVKLTRGDIVCEYEGEIVTWAECERRAELGYEGYAFFMTKHRCVDAFFTPDALGRYANDAKGIGRVEGLKNNAQYEVKTRGGIKKVFIVATRTIHPGDEILVDYGDDYWKNLQKTKPLYEQMQKEIKKKRKKAVVKPVVSSKKKTTTKTVKVKAKSVRKAA